MCLCVDSKIVIICDALHDRAMVSGWMARQNTIDHWLLVPDRHAGMVLEQNHQLFVWYEHYVSSFNPPPGRQSHKN